MNIPRHFWLNIWKTEKKNETAKTFLVSYEKGNSTLIMHFCSFFFLYVFFSLSFLWSTWVIRLFAEIQSFPEIHLYFFFVFYSTKILLFPMAKMKVAKRQKLLWKASHIHNIYNGCSVLLELFTWQKSYKSKLMMMMFYLEFVF